MKDKNKMLVLTHENGVEKLRCKVSNISAIQRQGKSLGPAGVLEYSTLYTCAGKIDVYSPNYDALLVKLGWNDV